MCSGVGWEQTRGCRGSRQRLWPEPRSIHPHDVNACFETPWFSAQMVQKRFGVFHPTAMKGLRRLKQMGILREITGKERNKLYLSTAVVDTVE